MSRARTMCIYGASGNGKTSQLIYLAKYVQERWGKTCRLVSADPGGWMPLEDEGLIWNPESNPNGIVQAFNVTNRPMLLHDMRKLSQGYWPYAFLAADGTVKTHWKMDIEGRNVGAYFIEGLMSIGSAFISHISKQDNENAATKVLYAAPRYEEGGESFGAVDRGHYGLVQKELENLVNQIGTLAIELMCWTSHVGAGEERTSRVPIYGPGVAGTAKTWVAPSWFAHCLHIEKEEPAECRLWFTQHKDSQSDIKYLAKASISPSRMREILEMYPEGYITLELGEGADKYLRLISPTVEATVVGAAKES